VRLDEILTIIITIGAIIIAVYAARTYGAKSHRVLTRIVAANIILDAVAIAIWSIPATQWSIYRLGFAIVGGEAAVAAALFAVTLFGLTKNKKWAPLLAIALTITQRIFATYIFYPSTAIALTTIWSLTIIYFAVKDIKTKT
jgi:CBS-domain-containing membrane protein